MSARSARLKNNPGTRRARRVHASTPERAAPTSSERTPESSDEIAVDPDVLERFFAAIAVRPDVLGRVSEPDALKRALAVAAPLTGAQWDKILDTVGPPRRRVLGPWLRSEQWHELLVAAGSDGRQSLWMIMERLLSTFARREGVPARDAYDERRKRDPRVDSALAIRLAAGAAVARVLDGALPSVPRWAVWPLLELDYENRPAHLYPFVQACAAVEQVLLSPAVPVNRTSREAIRGRSDADMSSYLDAIRQQLVRSIAVHSTTVADAIAILLSSSARRAPHRPRDSMSRMFYVGVRCTYEQASQGVPTAEDLADLWLCCEVEPSEPPKQVRQRWRDRIESCQRYFDEINPT